jgi:histidinol dehydrogenase
LTQAFDLANAYAPEHLCLLVSDPWSHVGQVRHAGGIFLGERSFEVLGDYVAGPSHVMPTGGTARFASPINVNDFVKIVSVIGLNETALQAIGPAAQVCWRRPRASPPMPPRSNVALRDLPIALHLPPESANK